VHDGGGTHVERFNLVCQRITEELQDVPAQVGEAVVL
jgi:hypothetical protein